MESLLQDIRYGIRLLLKNPAYTAIAVITLALGIGANSAIFSVVYGVILKPLPYQHPEQLVRIYSEFPTFSGGGLHRFWISAPEYLDLRRDLKSFQSLDAWTNRGFSLTGGIQPIRVTGSFVTGGMMQSMGVSTLMGRVITPEDDAPGAPLVIVLSQGLWTRAFGGDKGIIGKETILNGNKCTIIGVMPSGFEFPPGEADPPEVWAPVQLDPNNPGNRGGHFLYVLGRLKPDVSVTQARDEVTRQVQRYAETRSPNTHAFTPDNHPLIMFPLHDEVISSIRPALLMLSGAVFFVLLIACVNVANLLLARAEARQREIAVRTAMGASMQRLARQFVIEGILLALLGAVAGLALAYGGLRLMVLTNAGLVPRLGEITLNWKVLLFTLATCLGTGIFFGLAPLLHVASGNLHDPLKASAGRSTASGASQIFRKVLVCGEVALALVLLVGSGLMVKGFWKLMQVSPGFQSEGLLTMSIALPASVYPDNQSGVSFWSRMEEKARTIPGVQSAAIVSGLPPIRAINANDTAIEGLVPGPNSPTQNVDYWQTVTPGYFETVHAQLIEGRLLDNRDGDGSALTVVINQSMARHFYGNESAIGRRIGTTGGAPNQQPPWRTIVGVIADIKNAGMDQPAGTELYMPYSQVGFPYRQFYLVLRTSGDPLQLSRSATEAVHSLDPSLPVSSIRTMDEVIATATSRPRFLTLLLGLFSGLAMILAAVGIYGVMAYSVTQRTQEIGIRMALGAQPSDVLGMVLKNGMLLTAIGMVIGIGAAYGLTRLMKTLLFGVTATDITTFVTVPLVLVIVALVACYIPARRATRVDPLIALRYD